MINPDSIPHVLIVDDEPDIIELLELTLARMGMHVTSALNIANAKALLQSHAYQLCLTDMRLEDGSGLDLIQEIDPDAKTRIVVMTAHPTLDIAIDSLRARVADFLIKPVDVQHLLS